MSKRAGRLAVLALTLACAGCSGLPNAGPRATDVIDNSAPEGPGRVDYLVVDVTLNLLGQLENRPIDSLDGLADGAPAPTFAIAIGDGLAVTVWETGQSGLFSSLPAVSSGTPTPRGSVLPELVVDQDGSIQMPFAGRIAVAGKTPAQVESLIGEALRSKTQGLQVAVAVAHSAGNTVAVGGEVGRAARVPLGVNGDRILDVIAGAGGVRIPVNESSLRLTRGLRTVSIDYGALLDHPADNIFLRPGDVLTVVRAPKSFTAFGAFGRNLQIPFDTETLTAAEALAKAGGLLDERVDPAGIFVLRYEPEALAARLAPGRHTATVGGQVPVIYHLNMSQAGAYFLARRFAVRDKDIVYAANARLNQVQKFLQLLGSVLAPAATTAAVGATLR